MVRPGLKRLIESQRVKVQPNKTGTSKMLGMPFNKMNGIVYNQKADNRYNNFDQSPIFPTDLSTEIQINKDARANDLDKMCACNKKF